MLSEVGVLYPELRDVGRVTGSTKVDIIPFQWRNWVQDARSLNGNGRLTCVNKTM
jgi:hypothetical protein